MMAMSNDTPTTSALSAITFPAQSGLEHNQQLRIILECVQPYVAQGTIQTIKNEVNAALSMPLDDSKECASAHFWALHESWPYIHGIPKERPERALLIQSYKQVMAGGIYPFEKEKTRNRPN